MSSIWESDGGKSGGTLKCLTMVLSSMFFPLTNIKTSIFHISSMFFETAMNLIRSSDH